MNPQVKHLFCIWSSEVYSEKCPNSKVVFLLRCTVEPWGVFRRKGVLISLGATPRGQRIDAGPGFIPGPPQLSPFVLAHVRITSDDYRAEEHEASVLPWIRASVPPSRESGSAFAVTFPTSSPSRFFHTFENVFGLGETFVSTIVSSHCSDPSENPLLAYCV